MFGANVDAKNEKNQTARHLVATSKIRNRYVKIRAVMIYL